jgi:hypothetical protein
MWHWVTEMLKTIKPPKYINGVRIPDDLPDDPAEAYALGYNRGGSAGRKEGYDAKWKEK